MVQFVVDHADAVFAVIFAVQVLFCAVPSVLYLWRSERKSPIVLGMILAAAHLALVGMIALVGRGAGDAYLAWVLAGALDIPVTYLFRHFESVLSMQAFFVLIGTAQYVLAGALIGGAYRLARRAL